MKKWMMMVLMISLVAMPAFAQEAEETEDWVSELAVGFNLSDGNTDKSLLSVGIKADRKWDENEWLNEAEYVYGESDNDKDTDKASASSQYNRLLGERLFAYLRGEALYDDIADVDYRATLGPGMGYYLLKSEKTNLAIEGGVAYIQEKVGGDDNDYMALRFAERWEYAISETASFYESVEYLPEIDDMGTFLVNAEAGLEAALNGSLAMRLAVQDNYDSDPADDREKNDILLTVGLVQKL